VGTVDDVELTRDGDLLVLTALLCGPTAFGPRLGGRLGLWWASLGRRFRAPEDGYPRRIPISMVRTIDARGVFLNVPKVMVPTQEFGEWVLEKIVRRIPGANR
jgi:hypothetical protein